MATIFGAKARHGVADHVAGMERELAALAQPARARL